MIPKVFVADFNNILLELKPRVNLVSDPREADVWILWQDVRTGMRALSDINKDYLGKPVVVVQHGRGATRDYLPPNDFDLMANRICVWGPKEADRMKKAGYSDRTVITGSPLALYTRNPEPRKEIDKTVVVFSPIIAMCEQPENLQVYYTLKQIEFDYAKESLESRKEILKRSWHGFTFDETCATENTIPFERLFSKFFVVAKTTSIHDNELYRGIRVQTTVDHIEHLRNSLILLTNCDCVVGMEEGTFQLLATALDVPTVVLNEFQYKEYGGVANYDTMEVIRSEASSFCSVKDLRKTIEYELANKSKRHEARKRVVSEEFDPFPDKDPVELIIDVASELVGSDIRVKPQLQEVLKHGNSEHCLKH